MKFFIPVCFYRVLRELELEKHGIGFVSELDKAFLAVNVVANMHEPIAE